MSKNDKLINKVKNKFNHIPIGMTYSRYISHIDHTYY